MEAEFSKISYTSIHQNDKEGKLLFFDKKHSNSTEFYYLRPGNYSSITDIVEVMNNLFPERHNHNENSFTVIVSEKTTKNEIYLENGESSLSLFSTDLGHIFRSNVGYEFGVKLRGKGAHKTEFAYELVHIHSLMIYTDLIEYNVVGDTKAQLVRCFFLILKSKTEHIITTGQYMNFKTFINMQVKPLLENLFHK